MLSALIFIPERLPSFEIYGKVGVAKLDESLTVLGYDSLPADQCRPVVCNFEFNEDRTDSHPYVGIGARIKVARGWAVRLEGEAIDSDVGDNTTMFSVGIAWEY